jgi:hypothetical protein
LKTFTNISNANVELAKLQIHCEIKWGFLWIKICVINKFDDCLSINTMEKNVWTPLMIWQALAQSFKIFDKLVIY